MEGFPNGKIEVAQKVGTDEGDNTGVIKDFEELKPEVESVREFDVDGNSESSRGTHALLNSDSSNSPEEEAETEDHNLLAKDLGTLEEEVEKDVTDIIVESAEPIVPLPQELSPTIEVSTETSQEPDVTAEDQTEIEVKIFPSENEANEKTSSEEVKLPSSDDKLDLSAVATVVVSEGIQEKNKGGVPPALRDVESKEVEEAKVAALEDNGEPSGFVDKKTGENIDDLLKPSNDATTVGSSDGFLESIGNPVSIFSEIQ